MNDQSPLTADTLPNGMFDDPEWTATGERRASVALRRLETLWFNTGTLCNIACESCYILSSPENDALVYLTAAEVDTYLDEIHDRKLGTREIAFTGGEPFMNPDMCAMAESALTRGFDVLILTNAMRPMMRPRVREALAALVARFGDRLVLRISVDHHNAALHDAERGAGTFGVTLEGMRWLAGIGARMQVAARTKWDEGEAATRTGFARLFAAEGFAIDAEHPVELVLFPEMDETVAVPEITTACWGILGKSPESIMCSNARMVVRRKGADAPAVLACTLLAYDEAFELGATLAEADRVVPLNHPHCAKFCVLGGARCSV